MSDSEPRRARILFLHKDASFGRWLDSRLSGRNALVTSATTVEHAARALRLQAFDVLVVDALLEIEDDLRRAYAARMNG